MTPGKLAGMKAVADERGVIAAAAMDQRGSLQKALAKEKGGDVSDAMMEEFKIARHRSADAARERDPARSGVGPAGVEARARRTPGLLLAYEKTGYDKTGPGRLPDLLDDWSVRRLKEAGADCIKILLYYTPFDPKDVNDKKHAWVERIGDECRANDIPFFLEFVGYEEGADEKGLEFAKKKPEIVTGEHGRVHEGPVRRRRHEGRSADQHEVRRGREGVRRRRRPTRATRRRSWFLEAAKVATKPFIYLSAGVSNAEFTESLALAAESGVRFSGVLCGRATWKDGIPVYAKEGAAAFRAVARDEGRREHQERQRRAQAGDALVLVLRRESAGRAWA